LGRHSVVRKQSLAKRILEFGPVKKILLAVYNQIFNWYYS